MEKSSASLHGGLVSMAALCLSLTAHSQGITSVPDAFNYAVLYEGNGGNHLNVNNGPGSSHTAISGNTGIGNTGILQLSGPLTIDGNVNFSGSVNDNQGFGAGPGPFVNGNVTVTGSIAGGVGVVQSDLNSLNNLSATLGAEAGTSLAINTSGGNQAVSAGGGILDAFGNNVYTVTGISFNNGQTLTINGTSGQYVVFNISASANFNGGIILSGGITSDHVIFNFFGGSGLMGGPTFQTSGNFSGTGLTLTGIFLDPNGTINIDNTVLDGRVFGGDTHDQQIVSGSEIIQPTVGTVPDGGSTLAMLGLSLTCLGCGRKLADKLA